MMNTTEARANFATLLKHVEEDGAAIVRKANGRAFRITVEESGETSPFDGIRSFANIPLDEILDILHDSHERSLSN